VNFTTVADGGDQSTLPLTITQSRLAGLFSVSAAEAARGVYFQVRLQFLPLLSGADDEIGTDWVTVRNLIADGFAFRVAHPSDPSIKGGRQGSMTSPRLM